MEHESTEIQIQSDDTTPLQQVPGQVPIPSATAATTVVRGRREHNGDVHVADENVAEASRKCDGNRKFNLLSRYVPVAGMTLTYTVTELQQLYLRMNVTVGSTVARIDKLEKGY